MSAENRAKIAAAQKARGAKSNKTAKKAASNLCRRRLRELHQGCYRKVDSLKKIVAMKKRALPKAKTSGTPASHPV
jgi:hypothetical protein